MYEPSYYHWIATPLRVCQLRLVQHFKEKFPKAVFQLRENSYVGEYVLLQAEDAGFYCEINNYECACDELPHFKEIKDLDDEIVIVAKEASIKIMDADPNFEKLTEMDLTLVDVPEGTTEYQRFCKSRSHYRCDIMSAQDDYLDPVSLCDCSDCLENRIISRWSADCDLETAKKAFIILCEQIPEFVVEPSAFACGHHYLGKGDYCSAHVEIDDDDSDLPHFQERVDLWEHSEKTYGYEPGQIILQLPDIYDLDEDNLAPFKNLSRLLEKQNLFKYSRH